ncbi:hypothetical protein T4D_12687 [Trichinella pseudospiralis]|uniref:Uncharacterized protein n=1 Tax=Trichinella pseudospiralis TaxID=6337 RepID=A0A0V1FYM9_TRIPS|nr:hypothetical protein T4D_12687 [Trichinella pseudospiralis]
MNFSSGHLALQLVKEREAADGKKCSLSNSSCAILVIKNCNQNWHRITGQGRQNQEEHVGRGLLDFDEVETTSVSSMYFRSSSLTKEATKG